MKGVMVRMGEIEWRRHFNGRETDVSGKISTEEKEHNGSTTKMVPPCENKQKQQMKHYTDVDVAKTKVHVR